MQAVESGRAQHAYESVKEGYASAKKQKEFVASCKKLPMLIKLNGLVPALLFAKEKDQFGNLSKFVMDWIRSAGSPVAMLLQNRGEIGMLTELDSREYRQVTAEAQRYLGWVKRFAAAEKVTE